MAEKSHSENTAQEDKQDITRNLPSLTFESALDEDELLLLHLRQQSHAHTVLVCASSAFLISILNETRQIRANLARTSKQRRAIQLLTADTLPKDPIKIGIIGCGRLGTHLAKSLLAFSDISPSELYISTRRPEAVDDLKQKGVKVVYDNPEVAQTSHVLFLCILPSQLASVVEEIRGHITKETLIYCLVNNTSPKKLKRTLETSNMIIPKFIFDASTASTWNSHMSIHKALESDEMIRKCCPLSNEGKEACVHLTDKWVELVVCALVNHCTDLEMNSDAALDMVHGICMGLESFDKGTENRFTQTDFILNWKTDDMEPRRFPKFDLCKIHDNDSHLMKKLRGSKVLMECFVKRFSAVFQNYHEARKYNAEKEQC